MSTIDWGVGRYEDTATRLEPAARVVVDRAAPAAGERVVDVGCGTGNAALLAAERGAVVTGVDPAPRLLEVARADAAARGLDATFAPGHAAALPLGDGEADVLLSVFGVIFAPDPRAAAEELARVSAPAGAHRPQRVDALGGRPSGRARRGRGDADRPRRPAGPPPFAWHERTALAELFAPHGFEVTVDDEHLSFAARRPGASWTSRPTTRWRSPARPSSAPGARATPCASACSRSTRPPTRTRARSG